MIHHRKHCPCVHATWFVAKLQKLFRDRETGAKILSTGVTIWQDTANQNGRLIRTLTFDVHGVFL